MFVRVVSANRQLVKGAARSALRHTTVFPLPPGTISRQPAFRCHPGPRWLGGRSTTNRIFLLPSDCWRDRTVVGKSADDPPEWPKIGGSDGSEGRPRGLVNLMPVRTSRPCSNPYLRARKVNN